MELCEQNKCLGCGACANICPKGAITMAADRHGVLLPWIDPGKCVECGLCAAVCPVLNPIPLHEEGQCLVAWATDTELRRAAASAGIISALSKQILREGGVVFGTCFEAGRLFFDHIESEADIPRFQGSKYVHAHVGDAFRRVRDYLKAGRAVLFPGTPCQIAGLQAYLGRDYDNLLTVDLLCHGVSTSTLLNEYLAHKGVDRFDNVIFRGERGEKLVVLRDGKAIRVEDKSTSLFYIAYVRGLIHRENCYSCPFASTRRCSDLTAGDFWGLDRSRLKADTASIPYPSLVLVNTDKGKDFLFRCEIQAEERPISEALAGNGQLSRPCTRHPDREEFLSNHQTEKFHASLKRTAFYRHFLRQAVPYRIRRALGRVKRVIKK